MTSACPCGEISRPKKAGQAATRYRDVGPGGGSVEVLARRQRFACRGCGLTHSVEPVELLAPFRLTPRLGEAVFRRALSVGYLGAAEEFGVDERTVRDVFARLQADAQEEADAGMPDAILFRIAQGKGLRLAAAHDPDDGTLLNVYADPFDARIGATVGKLRDAAVHVDHGMAGPIRKMLHPSCVAVLHRASAQDALARLLPLATRRLAGMLDADGRRALQDCRHALRKMGRDMSLEEARSLRAAGTAVPMLEGFARSRDGLVSAWDTPELDEAVESLTRWRRGLGTTLRRAFVPALDWLDLWGPLALNAGYGAVTLAAWRRAEGHLLPVAPRDTPARVVARTLHAVSASSAGGRAGQPVLSGRAQVPAFQG